MTGTVTAERFVAALGARDFDGVEALLAPDVRFRALVPRALREHDNAADTAGRFPLWFGEPEVFEVLDSTVGEVSGRIHVAYRFRVLDEEGWQVVEQQAYLDAPEGRITDISIVCSGVVPVDAP